jgi:hypothetical protein
MWQQSSSPRGATAFDLHRDLEMIHDLQSVCIEHTQSKVLM